MPETTGAPSRLVDADGRTWDIVGVATGIARYRTDSDPAGQPVTIQDITLRAAPIRSVTPMTASDREYLTRALARLADHQPTKLIPTVLAAIYDANRITGPRNPLTAGRPTSWQSRVVTAIAYSAGRPILEGNPDGYDKLTLQTVADLIVTWVTDPAGYVEVASNLASVLGPVIDQAGGWAAVVPDDFDLDPHAEHIRTWATSHSTNPA